MLVLSADHCWPRIEILLMALLLAEDAFIRSFIIYCSILVDLAKIFCTSTFTLDFHRS